jgi:cardiolipin synthase
MTLAISWEPLSIYGLGILCGLATVPVILLAPKSAQGKIGWILVVLGLPWVGLLLYWIGGRSRLKRRVLRLRGVRGVTIRGLDRPLRASLDRLSGHGVATEMVRTAEIGGAFPPYAGNDVLPLIDGPSAFKAGLEAIDAAKDHIHVATYIFKTDRTGRGTLAALTRAAERGVEVRVLLDAVGSFRTSSKFFEPLVEAGGRVSAFLPVRPFWHVLRLNLRNHRKIIVVDGHTGFTGGMNIADEYADADGWRDIHVRVRGPAAMGLQRVFLEDWHFATAEVLDDPRYFAGVSIRGDVPVQVVAGGPDQESHLIESLYFGAIAAARRRVDVLTPYFLPTEPVYAAVKGAVLRGVPVRLLIPAKTDHVAVRLASEAVLPELMGLGVDVWGYPRMLHGKVLVVDDEWGTLGSANMDARSLRLNFELNVAFPHAPTAKALREIIDREIAQSRRLYAEDLRFGLGGRLLRNAAGLLAPIL